MAVQVVGGLAEQVVGGVWVRPQGRECGGECGVGEWAIGGVCGVVGAARLRAQMRVPGGALRKAAHWGGVRSGCRRVCVSCVGVEGGWRTHEERGAESAVGGACAWGGGGACIGQQCVIVAATARTHCSVARCCCARMHVRVGGAWRVVVEGVGVVMLVGVGRRRRKACSAARMRAR